VAQQHLAGAFNQTDTNDDGRLSFREAVVAVPGLGQETFDSLDVNGDGQLTPDELGMSDCYGCKGCQGGNSASVGDGFAFLFWLLGLIVMAHVKGG
jgi:hypothetical protein